MQTIEIIEDLKIKNPFITIDGITYSSGDLIYENEILRRVSKIEAESFEFETNRKIAIQREFLFPRAKSYQIRAWLIRNGIDLNSIVSIINNITQEGAERDEAIMRWEYAIDIPRDFPLVNLIGNQLNLSSEEIDSEWENILKI